MARKKKKEFCRILRKKCCIIRIEKKYFNRIHNRYTDGFES